MYLLKLYLAAEQNFSLSKALKREFKKVKKYV
jgi:hypothetical protein